MKRQNNSVKIRHGTRYAYTSHISWDARSGSGWTMGQNHRERTRASLFSPGEVVIAVNSRELAARSQFWWKWACSALTIHYVLGNGASSACCRGTKAPRFKGQKKGHSKCTRFITCVGAVDNQSFDDVDVSVLASDVERRASTRVPDVHLGKIVTCAIRVYDGRAVLWVCRVHLISRFARDYSIALESRIVGDVASPS